MSRKLRNNTETDNTPLQQFLTYRFSRLQAKLNAQAARMLKDLAGITVTQWRIIALVGSTGQATSAELVRISTIDKGLFSRNLKGLIRDGFVNAEMDKGDQRAQILSLSPRSRSCISSRCRMRRIWLGRRLRCWVLRLRTGLAPTRCGPPRGRGM